MKTLIKVIIGLAVVLAGLVIVAGRSLRDVGGYFLASAQTTVNGMADSLPRDVRDKKLDNDLAQARAELVARRVKLNQSGLQIERLRNELDVQAKRAERDRRLLAKACPVLEAATGTKQATVRFATAEIPVIEFRREIDELLARRARDTEELAVKREALKRLERCQQQAEQALTDSSRVLEAAEQKVILLKSRREHAETEGRTIALVAAISDSLTAPRELVGESLGRLRDEVTQLETQNEAQRTLSPIANRLAGETIVREFDRMRALKALRTEMLTEEQAASKAHASSDRFSNDERED
jgi:hypothetical protein